MNDKHDIRTYEKLAMGASFFLEESFNYLDTALKYDYISILYNEKIKKILPNEEDMKIVFNNPQPKEAVNLVQSNLYGHVSHETKKLFRKAWDDSMKRAENESHKFDLNHKIESTEILGHLNNLGFFMETLINRHLLFLKQSKKLNDLSYSCISTSRIMDRIVFIFKEDLNKNKVHLNEIQNLFRLRNKTVHYTPDNAVILNPKISQLITIWNQCSQLLDKLEQIEKFSFANYSKGIISYSNKFREKWV